MLTIKQAFTDCQRTAASHPKLVKHLCISFLKIEFEVFFIDFTNLLKKSLIHGDKQPAVDRTLNFVAKFATAKKVENEEKPEETTQRSEDEEEEEEEVDQFLVRLVQFLLNSHEANSQAVRFRVCQLINKILNQMGEEAVIDDELYSNIYDTMLHRLQDKVPLVRVQAVHALARLQDPKNKECPVIKAFRYHLSMDPNADVRRAVLSSIAITFHTLPDIIERTRDVRDLVRRQAYEVLSRKVHLKSLKIGQRVRLIREGLEDRSPMVRSAVEKSLIQSWLRMLNGNVLDFLSSLDVETAVKEAELSLQIMFQDVQYGDLIDNLGLNKDTRTLGSSELRPEAALYWRYLAQYLRKENADEALELLLPELKNFCTYVHEFMMTDVMDDGDAPETMLKVMEKEFISNQLVEIIMLYDLSDEVGRRTLDRLVRELLISDNVGEVMVKGLVNVFGKLHPATSRVNQLAEIISEVREPVTRKETKHPLTEVEQRKKKIEAAKIKVKINQIREDLEECVRTLDLGRAQTLKTELEKLENEHVMIDLNVTTSEEVVQEERTDPHVLIKCLKIVVHMLENPDITVMNPTLHSLHENLVLPCLRSEDPAVRKEGIYSLGLFCLISEELSRQHLLLFVQIARIDSEQNQRTALRCLVDIIHLYGLDKFAEAAEDMSEVPGILASPRDKNSKDDQEEENKEGNGGIIISFLCQMIENEDKELRTTAVEGLCKLLFASRITSSKLMTNLILLWYNPNTEDDCNLRHLLGVFFPYYAQAGGSSQECVCLAVLPTLKALFEAPSHSPLADVDIDDVANFLVSITSPAIVMESSSVQVNYHDTLVFTLCTEVLAYPESSWNKTLIRCLNNLSLSPTNYATLRQVEVLASKMLKRVTLKVCTSGLERFKSTIQNMLKNAPEETIIKIEVTEPTEAEIENDLSNVDDSMNKTAENTVIRKKRQLHNTLTYSDPEMMTSELESDYEGTPTKRQSSSDFGSPRFRSTQKDNDSAAEEPNKSIDGGKDNQTELELTTEAVEVENDSEDLFESSPTLPSNRRRRNDSSPELEKSAKMPRSSISSEATDDGTPETTRKGRQPRFPSSEPRGRRRTKKESRTIEESSDEEVVLPPKLPRKGNNDQDETSVLDTSQETLFANTDDSDEEGKGEEVNTDSDEEGKGEELNTDSDEEGKGEAVNQETLANTDPDESKEEEVNQDTSANTDPNESKDKEANQETPVGRMSSRRQPPEETPDQEITNVTSSAQARKRGRPKKITSSQESESSPASSGGNGRATRRNTPIVGSNGGRATRKNTPVATATKTASKEKDLKQDMSEAIRRSGRRNKDDLSASMSSVSSRSSTRGSQATVTSEDTTPGRRSRRANGSSQSTDSGTEKTPVGKRSTRTASAKKPETKATRTRK